MRKLNDFGEKIGGAKKDIWALFNSLSNEEQGEMAQKVKLWKRPDYRAMVKNGTPKDVCFWQSQMRKAVISRPKMDAAAYVKFVIEFKADVEACNTLDEIKAFYAGYPKNAEENGIFKYLVKTSADPDDKRWTYASSETKPFFDGNLVLRYVYRPKMIAKECDASGFLDDRETRENAKYEITVVKRDNVKSEQRNDGSYKNTVTCSDCMKIYYDTRDYSDTVKSSVSGELFIAEYDRRRIAVCMTKEEAEDAIKDHKEKIAAEKAKEKKEAFLPPHLSKIERTGSDYNFFRFSDGNILMARYGLRGGEFGNYTTSKDRLGSINMAYDAFEDLHKALGISAKDISLGDNLAIAFGARGRGSAMAHYEPVKNVINMTKRRGAGSLAHEWGHAMDAYIGKKLGLYGFMSQSISAVNVPESAKELIEAMKMQDNKETEFYIASKYFDKSYKKAGNGYWSSTHEMFARAFACYVRDKLGDRKSDYLVGHSEFASDGIKTAVPMGDERKVINENFDAFISDMISLGYFSKNEENNQEKKTENEAEDEVEMIDIMVYEDENGQLMFC